MPLLMGLRRLCLFALVGSLAACATIPRTHYSFDGRYTAEPPGFSSVRIDANDPQQSARFEADIRKSVPATPDHRFSILALSGGGAQGAYGAGVLVGWTEAGNRPEFQIVTGASTGALIAPMAFLGPAWDPELKTAFTGGEAAGLLAGRGVLTPFSIGLFSADRLRSLVGHYVTDRMIRAVAAENIRGRRLLIATTDLDTQRTIIWDMGQVAARGGAVARSMFIDILVASASVPGVFPPVMIPVTDGSGRSYEEMHADGGTVMPFFTVPESLLLWTAPDGEARRGSIYIIVNSQIEPSFTMTKRNTLTIVGRGFDTMLKSATRTSLAATEAFCLRNSLGFQIASVPLDAQGTGFLDFRTKTMRALFREGEAEGRTGKAWRSSLTAPPLP